MLFEVVNRDGQAIMQTEHMACIYEKDTLKAIQQSGYYFRLNGRRASLQTVIDTQNAKA